MVDQNGEPTWRAYVVSFCRCVEDRAARRIGPICNRYRFDTNSVPTRTLSQAMISLRSAGLVLLLLLAASQAHGQGWFRGRVSLQMEGSTIEKSFAPGVHLDAKMHVGGQYSIIAGTGVATYVLEGRRSGTYTFDPTLTLHVTRPSRSLGANTFSLGGGYHYSSGNRGIGWAPSAHLGIGRLWTLRESTLFVDLRPTVVIRKEGSSMRLPLRAGVVF